MRCTLLAGRVLVVASLVWHGAAPVRSQMALDETCVVGALNRTTRVLADGSWVLPNVPTSFGQIRVRANCVDAGGVTRAGQSELVTLPASGTLRVTDIVFDVLRPIPARLSLVAPRALLGAAGESVQLQAIATMPNGLLSDVTVAETGTNYRSSNPAVAAVGADGLVTAATSGTVLVSATHEGTLGVVQITVVASADSDGDGLPDDFEIGNGLDPNNAADAQQDPDLDRLSTGEEFSRGLDPFDSDTDGDGLDDGREALELGTDPVRFDTDGDGVSDGLELELGTDPLDAASVDLAAALVSLEILPPTFAILFDSVLGAEPVDLRVIGALRDGSTLDLTSTARGTAYATSDPAVCSLGVEPGRIFAGQPGACTVTASNNGKTALARGIVQSFGPRLLTSLAIQGRPNAIAIAGDHGFVGTLDEGLQIVDVADRGQPRIVAAFPTAGPAHDVTVTAGVALVAAGSAGLELVDVGDPSSPRPLAALPVAGEARGVAVAGGVAAVAAAEGGVALVDVSDPDAPLLIGSAATAGAALAVALAGDATLALVAEGEHGVEVFDLSDPAHPVARGRVVTGDARSVLFLDGEDALVADRSTSLTVVDLGDPSRPRIAASVGRELGGIPVDVARFGSLAFTADVGFFAEEAVPIFDVSEPATPRARTRMVPASAPGRSIAADATYLYHLACTSCGSGAASGEGHLDIGQYRSLRDEAGVPPSVTLVAPRDGDVVRAGSSLQASVEAADDVGVLAVELLVDGVVAGRDERPAYSFSLPVPFGVDRLTLGARAYDFAANTALAEEIEVVVESGESTTVTGAVVGPDRRSFEGARVVLQSLPGAALSGAAVAISGEDGVFTFEHVAVGGAPIVALASAVRGGEKLRGESAPVAPEGGGTTDVGAIVLQPVGILYPGPRVSTGTTALAAAVADFDRDGVADAAVAHSSTAQGIVILRGRGDGSFVVRQRLAISAGFAAAGDLTLDGAPELVVGIASASQVTVLVNDGAGNFSIGGSRAVGSSPRRARIGDFDLDGRADVIVVNAASGDLSLLLGNGDGTLSAQARVAVGSSPEDLAVADLDLDGWLDVAVARAGGSGERAVAVLRGGAGGLLPATTLAFSLPPLRVEAGDFDRDGLPDLAIAAGRFSDSQRAFVALGGGDGSFVLASSLGTALSGSPLSIAVADLDGDGAMDLAVARDRTPCRDIRWLRGDGSGLLGSSLGVVADDCALRDIAVLPAALDSPGGGGARPHLLGLDEDGVTTHLAAGEGEFERRHRLTTPSRPVQVVAGEDFDRDGRLDLAYRLESSTGIGIQLGTGDGSYGPASVADAGIVARLVAAGDVDGDGLVDLAIASLDDVGVMLGRGDGSFAPPVLTPIARSLTALVVDDVSGDGRADLVATNGERDELLVFPSRGDGSLESAFAVAVGDSPRGVAIADLDRDALLDAVVVNGASDDLSVLLGIGGGQLVSGGELQAGEEPLAVAVADLDLDGDVDLVVANATGSAGSGGFRGATVLLGGGDGTFGAPLAFATAATPSQAVPADVDRDGIPDLVLLHQETDDLSILLGAGDGTFVGPEGVRTGSTPVSLDVADVDGDGRLDLVTADRGDNVSPGISVILHR